MHEPRAAVSSSRLLPPRLQHTNSCWSMQQPRPGAALLRRQRRELHVAANGAIVPNMPFPGDDQASTIFTALSEVPPPSVLENAEEELAKTADQLAARLGSAQGASSTAVDAVAAASTNGAMPGGPQQQKPKVPHRWVIVGAMAAAFVLCNMDKVRTAAALHAIECGTVQPALGRHKAVTGMPQPGHVLCGICGCAKLEAIMRLYACAPTGEHVSGSHPHGSRAGLERQRQGTRCVHLDLHSLQWPTLCKDEVTVCGADVPAQDLLQSGHKALQHLLVHALTLGVCACSELGVLLGVQRDADPSRLGVHSVRCAPSAWPGPLFWPEASTHSTQACQVYTFSSLVS
jgi:hypothetical protein